MSSQRKGLHDTIGLTGDLTLRVEVAGYVIDSCVVLRYLLVEDTVPEFASCRNLCEGVQNGEFADFAPDHLFLEVAHGCRKHSDFEARLRRARSLGLQPSNISVEERLNDLLEIVREGVGSYDALFVWLARELNRPLLTVDKNLIRDVRGAGLCDVGYPSDYGF